MKSSDSSPPAFKKAKDKTYDVRQAPDLDRIRSAVWPHQAIRLRSGTLRPRHPIVRGQKTGAHRDHRHAGLIEGAKELGGPLPNVGLFIYATH